MDEDQSPPSINQQLAAINDNIVKLSQHMDKNIRRVDDNIVKLSQHMDERFEQVDQRFQRTDDNIQRINGNIQALGERLDHTDESILKLYQHMEERFDRLEETKADKEQVDQIMTTLDGIAARLDTDDHERVGIISEQRRHRKWIGQLADHTHAKLVPEQ